MSWSLIIFSVEVFQFIMHFTISRRRISGHFVYYCLNRDNAKRGLVIYRESFDTYVENVMPGFFQFRPILQQLLSIGRIQVKLDLQY